jgi:hypothetical protein
MRTTLGTVPASVPYLRADAELVEHWRAELRESAKCKVQSAKPEIPAFTTHFAPHTSDFFVGIAWQGNPTLGGDRERSILLAEFAPLAQVPGLRLISLQKGPGSEQLEKMKDKGGRMKQEVSPGFSSSFILHPSSFVLDETSGPFMDTAAIMTSLDLVICSDSAVAHLAGALGISVWLVLGVIPDWRWMLQREDSPWYPTMRLFRQTQRDNWSEVFTRMAEELRKSLLQSGHHART